MVTRKLTFAALSLWVLAAAGCGSLSDALQMQKPTAALTGLKFDNITLESASLLFDLEVKNPYSVALPLSNLDYHLASSDKPLLAGAAELQSSIPAQSTQTVTLPATIKYLDLVKAFQGVRPGSVIPYQADLGLSVKAPALGNLRLPIKKNGELAVPEIPKLSDINLNKLLDKIK